MRLSPLHRIHQRAPLNEGLTQTRDLALDPRCLSLIRLDLPRDATA